MNSYTLQELREAVRTGQVQLGPAATTMVLPVLLPWRCCRDARETACGRCGAVGYTHGAFERALCLYCDTDLCPAVRRVLAREK